MVQVQIFKAIWEQEKQRLIEDVVSLNPNQRTYKPSVDAWSALEVLHHCAMVESKLFAQIARSEEILKRRYFKPHWLGRFIFFLVFRFGFKVRMPVKGVAPNGALSLDAIRSYWEPAHAGWLAFLENQSPEDAGKKIFLHPIRGPMTTAVCFDFLIKHLRHHRKQIGRIKRSKGFPKGA